MSWPILTIDKIKAKVSYACVGGPFGSDLTTRDYVDDGVPVIRGGNLSSDKQFHDAGFVFVSDEKAAKLGSNTATSGDVLFTQRGTLGQVGLIPSDSVFPRYVISQSQMKLTVDPEVAYPEFIYWWFRQSHIVELVKRRAITSGVPHINLGILKSLEVCVPPLDVQERIVVRMRAIDDLIENNRRRIKLLEESVRLLYREWFVHLRFPGHEHVKIVDDVPEDWEVRTLEEISDELRIAVNPEMVTSGTPYIGLEHMPRRSITLSDWGQSDDITSQKFAYESGDILFGKIRPYFHKVGFTLTDGITSSDAIVIRPVAQNLRNFLLLLVSSDQFVALVSKTVKEGSKMPRADWKYMKRQIFAVPSDWLLAELNEICEPIIDQLKSLSGANAKLRQARDLLLPRLMSGEIVV